MDKKKKLIIEIAIFIILLVVITIIDNYLVNKHTKQDIQKEYTLKNIKEDEKVEIIEIKDSEQFKKEVLNEEKTVFVDFYATWCMPCKAMSPVIEEIAKEYKEVKFVKVDVDENEEIALEYNVMSIPTMIIMKNGKVTKNFVGVTKKEDIIKEF